MEKAMLYVIPIILRLTDYLETSLWIVFESFVIPFSTQWYSRTAPFVFCLD